MNENLKYVLWILIAVIALMITGYFVFKKSPVTQTSTIITTEKQTLENTITIESFNKLQKRLADSLKVVYGGLIDSLTALNKPVNDSVMTTDYLYTSEIDSQFVFKDADGSVTDSLKVKSVFISLEPLASVTLHLLNLEHKSFRDKISSITEKTETVPVINNQAVTSIAVGPNISYGYGIRTKELDFYAGVGITVKIDFLKLFTN